MQNIRLFELANIHTSSGVTLDSIFEKKFLSGVLSGYSLEPSVHTAGFKEDLFDLKGYVECLFVEKLGMRLKFIKKEISGFDQAWRLIVNNIKVGSMGKISSNWIEKMNLDILFYTKLFMQWEESLPVHQNILKDTIQKKLVI